MKNRDNPNASIPDRTLVISSGTIEEADAERIHQLLVIEGVEQGRTIELDQEALTLGRLAPSDVVLRDVEISRTHCRIYREADAIHVSDMNSTNGTFVDGQRVTNPVRLTDGCVLRIGRHQLKYERRTRREIDLSRDFERSLEGARRYVQSMLPQPIVDGPVRTEWLLIPCARLGGDALGYRWIDSDHFAMYLLDVSGHGPEAAMLAVGVMNTLRQKALPGADLRDPAGLVNRLNALFQMEDHNLMYFTLWYGVYQLSTRTLSYCSAGQHPAYLVHAGAHAPQPLRTPNPPVGVTPSHRYRANATPVPANATLYLFSDGVFEINTKSGARWELDDLLPTLLDAGMPELAETQRIHHAVQAVAGRTPFEDDFSVLVTQLL